MRRYYYRNVSRGVNADWLGKHTCAAFGNRYFLEVYFASVYPFELVRIVLRKAILTIICGSDLFVFVARPELAARSELNHAKVSQTVIVQLSNINTIVKPIPSLEVGYHVSRTFVVTKRDSVGNDSLSLHCAY